MSVFINTSSGSNPSAKVTKESFILISPELPAEIRQNRETLLSALQEMLDRTQTYQHQQGGDTAEPLAGNYGDAFHTHTHTFSLYLKATC